jgi:hypothetical protein
VPAAEPDNRRTPGPRAAWWRRGLAATVLAGLTLAALPGLAGAASVSPEKWSQSVCQALASYKRDGTAIEKNAGKAFKNVKDLKAIRAKYAAFLQTLAKRTDQAVRAIGRAGTPNVANGAAVAAGFQTGFAQIRDTFARLVTEARQLPTANLAEFQSAFMSIQNDLEQADIANQATFQSLNGLVPPDLNAVFNAQPACTQL